MRFIHRLGSWAMVLTSTSINLNAAPSKPLTMDQEVFLTFESICLVNAERLEKVPALLGSMKTMEIDKAQSAPLLEPQTGRMFALKGEAALLFIGLTDLGACMVFSRDADGSATETLLQQNTKNIQLTRETVGSELQTAYAISYPAAAGVIHVMTMVDRPNIAGITGLRITSLPESVIKAKGLKVPQWP